MFTDNTCHTVHGNAVCLQITPVTLLMVMLCFRGTFGNTSLTSFKRSWECFVRELRTFIASSPDDSVWMIVGRGYICVCIIYTCVHMKVWCWWSWKKIEDLSLWNALFALCQTVCYTCEAHWCLSNCVLLGDSGGVVNSLDFHPASLKSLGCFYFGCVLSSQWNAVTANLWLLHCNFKGIFGGPVVIMCLATSNNLLLML